MREIGEIRTDVLEIEVHFWRGHIQVFFREECFQQIDAPPIDGQSLKHNDCADSCGDSYTNGYFKSRSSILARTDIRAFEGVLAG